MDKPSIRARYGFTGITSRMGWSSLYAAEQAMPKMLAQARRELAEAKAELAAIQRMAKDVAAGIAEHLSEPDE